MNMTKMNFLGDFISGQFMKPDKIDGQFKDISPADLTDQLLTVSYQLDRVDLACPPLASDA